MRFLLPSNPSRIASFTIPPDQYRFLLHELWYALIWSILIAVLAVAWPRMGCRLFGRVAGLLGRIARRPALAIALVGLIAFLMGPLFAWTAGLPLPRVHDEFSYLLAGDTFVHGRLTNPPHPMWVHFETYHVLQQPTYASKYPPGQGMLLALGQILTGLPIVGVWISAGLACAALCWMLYAWIPARWAFLGGLLAAVHPVVVVWSQNYWGGLVAMTGGAVIVGAMRRVIAHPGPRPAVALGIGMAIVANSRPYEGAILSVCALVTIAAALIVRKRLPAAIWLRQVAVPLAAVLLVTGLWMAYYNLRVTHHPFLMPYALHEATYAASPQFVWQPPKPPPRYHHAVMRDFYTGYDSTAYDQMRTPTGFVQASAERLLTLLWWYFLPLLMVFPLLATLPAMLRREPWMRTALIVTILAALALFFEKWRYIHYSAPIAGLVFLFVFQGLRYLYAWRWRSRPVGRSMVHWGLVVSLLLTANWLRHFAQTIYVPPWGVWWANVETELSHRPGQHLVLVHYSPAQSLHREWVFNRADIDAAKVVWARDMGPVRNRELLDYFRGRHVWRLEADALAPRPVPYDADSASHPGARR